MDKKLRVARRANLPLTCIDLINNYNLSELIKKDVGTDITSRLYYSKIFNSKNSVKAKEKLTDLILRNASKVTKYKGFSVNEYFDKTKSKRNGLDILPNLNWLRGVALIVSLNQSIDSDMKFSINYEYEINGDTFVWQIPRRNKNDLFIHIKRKSLFGKLINLFLKYGNLTYKQVYQFLGASKNGQVLIKYLIQYKIIFSELDNNQVTINQILCFTNNKKLSKIKNKLEKINKSFDGLSNKPKMSEIIEIKNEMNNIYFEDDPLTLNRWEYVKEKDNFNLPKELKLLFRLMGTLDKSYQYGRAYKKCFEDKYGYYRKIPVKTALFINNPGKFNSLINPYLLNDKLFLNVKQKWDKVWLKLLSKSQNNILYIKHRDIDEFIKILSPLQDHIANYVNCHLFYSRMADNTISLPFFALQPTFSQNNKISISYFANNFPEVDEKDTSKNKVYLNQFTPSYSYSLDDIFIVLTREGLQFVNKNNQILKLNWGSILETKVKGESQFLTRLKNLCDYICQFPINALPPYYDSLYHIPKIMYKNIALCPEIWNLNFDEFNRIKDNSKFLIIENGTFFPLIKDKKYSKKDSYTVTRRMEYKGSYFKQNINLISFDNFEDNKSTGNTFELEQTYEKNNFKYQSYNLLLPNPDFEFYITNIINQLTECGITKEYFFIRYFDQNYPSIRFRYRGANKKMQAILTEFCKKNGIKLVTSTYLTETNRYGDGKLLEKIEKEFELESRNYLNYHKSTKDMSTLDSRVFIELNFVIKLNGVINKNELNKLYKEFQKDNQKITLNSQIPDPIFDNLSSIFKLSKENWNFERFEYNYFSLIHMAQNRLLGSNDEEEKQAHSIIKRMIRSGTYEKNFYNK